HPEAFAAIIHASREMRAVLQYTEAIACTSQTVLITGETGVGKELVARAVHIISGRKGPFVAVNVAGLDDNVFSDTLFGHKKGAFTGAEEERSGLLEKASGGTLFLDEIGDLPPSSQVKLLRLLQEHEYFPLGSDILKQSDARIVVATNKDIQDLQESGRLRADLYFRLHTHHVHIPPLKERTDDLPVLLDHFFEAAARALKKKTPTVPKELLDLCKAYSFPGNVRELESMVFDAVSSHGSGVLSLNAFKKAMGLDKNTSMRSASDPLSTHNVSISFSELLPKLKEAEQILIDEAMKRADGNQGIAASMLGISRQALNRRLKTRKK
ncbi:MAG: sigma-54-dependent Fis family transcriptional regulator, partial [Deltaproteobacteria bacterium]